ncbi:hypothetical protein [Alloactinosynnema sp. L-07]|uniref:hypothetical protein n=1 Tax=Alloactinosynnema sp. L-07 TaxID=1653480 RepID=UPI00065F0396|nr:hypothetical protein [Alloactinosynnema sp. L-07]CRK59547.1 hypothetical protein [Alloactinosynnema sp. L-07]
MQLRELDALLVSLLSNDHPEIVNAELIDKESSPHSRVRVDFASGARVTIQVRSVEGPGVPAHQPYAIPSAVI